MFFLKKIIKICILISLGQCSFQMNLKNNLMYFCRFFGNLFSSSRGMYEYVRQQFGYSKEKIMPRSLFKAVLIGCGPNYLLTIFSYAYAFIIHTLLIRYKVRLLSSQTIE